jgi:hypothetical protein
MMKKPMMKGGKMGNPAALPSEKFSARAKRATLRGDDMGTFKKGGMAKMPSKGMMPKMAKGGYMKGGKC